jgi:hypothetical protein
MKIAIIPNSENLLENKLFDSSFGRDNNLKRFIELRKALKLKGVNIETIDRFSYNEIDIIISLTLTNSIDHIFKCIKINPNVKIIHYAIEPYLVDSLNDSKILDSGLFDAVLTWNDNFIEKDKYIETRSFSFINRIDHDIDYNNKKYLCLINYYKKSNVTGELYSHRDSILKFFLKKGKIDLYGYGWENHSDKIISSSSLGPIQNKSEILKNYKFSIAFENVNNEPGYICEKIFDSFSSKTIPIFYGAPNVKELIPENTFIDFRDFKDLSELEYFLDSIDSFEYDKYLNAISDFTSSSKYKKFTSEGFVESVSVAITYVNRKNLRKNFFSIKLSLFIKLLVNPKILIRAKNFFLKLILSIY